MGVAEKGNITYTDTVAGALAIAGEVQVVGFSPLLTEARGVPKALARHLAKTLPRP